MGQRHETEFLRSIIGLGSTSHMFSYRCKCTYVEWRLTVQLPDSSGRDARKGWGGIPEPAWRCNEARDRPEHQGSQNRARHESRETCRSRPADAKTLEPD